MSKVSRRFLDKQLEKYIFKIFSHTISELKSEQEINNFLEDLLSPSEKIMLVKRLAIALMLSKGYTYDQIDQTLKVSRPTIMNVSFFLKHSTNNGYKSTVSRFANKQKDEEFTDKIEQILLTLSPKKLYESQTYEKKKKAGRELFLRKLLRNRF